MQENNKETKEVMKTKVRVELYKRTGKLYTTDEFETDTPAHARPDIIYEIESRPQAIACKEMSYTFEAIDIVYPEGEGPLNKRLIIRH